jgi:hypothetical protein
MTPTHFATLRALCAADMLPVYASTKAGKFLGLYGTQADACAMHGDKVTLSADMPADFAAAYDQWAIANPAPVARLPRTPNGKVDRYADRLRASSQDKPVARVHAYVYANPGMQRKDLMTNLVNMGIAFYTARTQVQAALKAAKDNPALYAQADSDSDSDSDN